MTPVASESRESLGEVSGPASQVTERQGSRYVIADGVTASWKRWLSIARGIAVVRSCISGTRWSLDVQSGNAAELEAFADLDRVFQMDGVEASGGRFCRVIKVRLDGRDYYVKRYRPQGVHFWKAFGRSWPIAEYRNLAYFAGLGIPVPRTVAYGSQRVGGLFRRGAIVTEAVPLAIDMKVLARTRPDLFRDQIWLSHVLSLLADYVKRIHSDGFTHGALKWRNLLVTMEQPPQVFFLDCPRGSHKLSFWHEHGVIKDLATLDRPAAQHVSRTARLRFYLRYRNQTRLTREDKEFIAKVLAYQRRKARASSSSGM